MVLFRTIAFWRTSPVAIVTSVPWEWEQEINKIFFYGEIFSTKKGSAIVTVTNDRSEARVDPLAALLVQGQTGKYQAGVSRAT